jgi:hypothetical protein
MKDLAKGRVRGTEPARLGVHAEAIFNVAPCNFRYLKVIWHISHVLCFSVLATDATSTPMIWFEVAVSTTATSQFQGIIRKISVRVFVLTSTLTGYSRTVRGWWYLRIDPSCLNR